MSLHWWGGEPCLCPGFLIRSVLCSGQFHRVWPKVFNKHAGCHPLFDSSWDIFDRQESVTSSAVCSVCCPRFHLPIHFHPGPFCCGWIWFYGCCCESGFRTLPITILLWACSTDSVSPFIRVGPIVTNHEVLTLSNQIYMVPTILSVSAYSWLGSWRAGGCPAGHKVIFLNAVKMDPFYALSPDLSISLSHI